MGVRRGFSTSCCPTTPFRWLLLMLVMLVRGFYLVIVQQTNAGLEASSTQVKFVCFFLGDGGLAFYDLEESCILSFVHDGLNI